jgi:NAD-dependent dihydropyrimidine dehydrogenase PreA subunit
VIWEKCMGCGVCEGHCDTGAIVLVRDERKGVPLDVREIGVAAAT